MGKINLYKIERIKIPFYINDNDIFITADNNNAYTSLFVNGKEFVEKATNVTLEGTVVSLEVQPNICYNCGTITSLTITSIPNSSLESLIYFSTGETCQITLPDCEIVGDIIIEPNKKYVFSILNGILIMGEINNYENV